MYKYGMFSSEDGLMNLDIKTTTIFKSTTKEKATPMWTSRQEVLGSDLDDAKWVSLFLISCTLFDRHRGGRGSSQPKAPPDRQPTYRLLSHSGCHLLLIYS